MTREEEERMAGGEEWTDDELRVEIAVATAASLTHTGIRRYVERVLEERARLRARAEFAEQLAGLDVPRRLVDVGSGLLIGCAVSALLVWAL